MKIELLEKRIGDLEACLQGEKGEVNEEGFHRELKFLEQWAGLMA